MPSNTELKLALNFVEKTDRNLFLTGKAGTGKTTFLHKIKDESYKRLIVVAPTGVAAINAKGVTIHSFFQLPFGPILPNTIENNSDFKHKFSSTKLDIMRSLDLLIIDEISMVRADLLDGIDQVLRRYKNKDKVFGGVQILMIGDLQQLAPVSKQDEWELLRTHYETPYFFSSKAFRLANAVGIELKNIYRQDNETFIKILNEIRNDKLTTESAKILNKRYLPNFEPQKDDGYITLTTHNNIANAQNALELKKIKSESCFYHAIIEGTFNEYAYPTNEKLELKVGAQVMYIKNDSSPEKRYFNGKIGKIIDLENNKVIVQCSNDKVPIETSFETWENINYSIKAETKEIVSNVIGSFSQMPLRLAWAITIHKSQGLTFDKAIIDAQASFAHGQTYVALSRCRTLEGIILKNPIIDSSIINDNRVASFNSAIEANVPDNTILKISQKTFQLNLIEELFNFYPFLFPVTRLIELYRKNENLLIGNIIKPLISIKEQGIVELLKVSTNFKSQLENYSDELIELETNANIQDRLKKAVAYFSKQTIEKIKNQLDTLTFSTDNNELHKDMDKFIEQLSEKIFIKLFCFEGLLSGFSTAKYLELRAKAVLQKSKIAKVKTNRSNTTKHPKLFALLQNLQTQFADSENVNRYQIFTQKSLYDMCELLPTTNQQLKAVNGMGKVRIKKYGADILKIISNYCDNKDIKPIIDKPEIEKPNKLSTQMQSFELFKNGLDVKQIALKRALAVSTIEGHLSQFIATGAIEISALVPKNRYLELKKILEEVPFESLSQLKEKISDEYTYGELKMLLKDLEYKKSKFN